MKPPYVIRKGDGYYWQPRGRIAEISSPQPLGSDEATAYSDAARLYYQARAALKEPSSKPRVYTISWGIAKWRESDDYRIRADGREKARRSIQAQEMGLKVIEKKLGAGDLRALKKRHAKSWYKQLRDDRGNSMAASIMRTLRQLYSYFIDEGWYEGEHPATKLRLHVPQREYEAWTFEGVKLFVDTAIKEGRRSVALGIALIYETAQNPIDVLTVRWSQFDGQGIDLSRSKTGVGAYVPLSEWCRSLLQDIQREAVQIVVSERTKRPYTYRNFAKHVALIRDCAGLPSHLKAGNLRHEAGQEAEAGGAHPGAIQALLAHKSVGTQKYYVTRKRADKAQEAREKHRKQSKNETGT